jgi:hypothetical protein
LAWARSASTCGLRAAKRLGARRTSSRLVMPSADLGADFVQRSVTSSVEDALEGFIDGELGRGAGILLEHCVVEAAEERDAFADLFEGEDAGVEAVVEVGGEVGDLVGQVDELGFEGRELVEEVFGQFGVVGGGVVAGVLDDAFADGEGEVEAAKGGVALLEPGDDAQGVEVVVEARPCA